ncbi:MAG: DUF1667 domain-containing protein [Oscillospiraceae bacterium]
MKKREMICVSCPIGCPITVVFDDCENITSISGNTCKRGDAYARAECTHPERMLTSTVKVEGGRLPVVSIKTSSPVPKERLFDCMKEVNKVDVKAPVKIGDVIIKDILGLGVDIVATNEV